MNNWECRWIVVFGIGLAGCMGSERALLEPSTGSKSLSAPKEQEDSVPDSPFIPTPTVSSREEVPLHLVCRGGVVSMDFYVQADRVSLFSDMGAQSAVGKSGIALTFTKASSKAGESMPAGSCALLDRPISASEPTQIVQVIPFLRTMYSFLGPTEVYGLVDQNYSPMPSYFPFTIARTVWNSSASNFVDSGAGTLLDPAAYWTFTVHLDKKLFVVDSFCKGIGVCR